jgi:hypothetical protein
MRRIVFLVALLAAISAWAIPPKREAVQVTFAYNSDYVTVYLARAPRYSFNSDLWQCVALSNPFDALTLTYAIRDYANRVDKGLDKKDHFYPVEVVGGIPYWAMHNASGKLVPSEFIVGVDPPISTELNRICSEGLALSQDSLIWAETCRDYTWPLDDFRDDVNLTVLIVGLIGDSGNVLYQGEDISQFMEEQIFGEGPTCFTPDGRETSTVKHWFEVSTDDYSTLYPSTEFSSDVDGFANTTDNQGRFNVLNLGLNADSLISLGSAWTVLNDVILPKAQQELGISLTYSNTRPLLILYNHRWDEQWGTPLWPQAYFDGVGFHGIFERPERIVSGCGGIVHEILCHSTFRLPDTYGGASNNFDIMCYGCYNGPDGYGDFPPYLPSYACFQLGFEAFYKLEDADDLGPHIIRKGESFYTENPNLDIFRPERQFYEWIRPIGNDAYIGFSGTRLLTWWTWSGFNPFT